MELAFVLGRRQNQFFVEIVEAIRDELAQAGVESSVHWDGFPQERDDLVYVLVPPHEWFNLEGRYHEPTTSQLARTIFICAEQPGTAFFDDDVLLAPLAGAVFDINVGSVHAFAGRAIEATHLPLGWTRSWDHAPPDADGLPSRDPERDIDVLHIGIRSARRTFALAAAAPWLSHRRCHFVLGDDDRPNPEAAANYIADRHKWEVLRRSRVLLNVHVADRPYFEWLRVVQAISCGCAVVSEHSIGTQPLLAGEHFLAGRPEVLGLLANHLLRDEDTRASLTHDAYRVLREELPFAASVASLIQAAEEIVDRRARGGPAPSRPLPELRVAPHVEPRMEAATQYPEQTTDPDAAAIRAALKDNRLELLDLRRQLDRLERFPQGAAPKVEVVAASRGYEASKGARVSVVTPLYNYAHHIETTLASVARGRFRDIELVVVDDGSTDASLERARLFMEAQQGVQMLLLRHPINRGLGAARNTAMDFARGEMTFMLDADNETYPFAVQRLVSALEADPEADAAYGMLEQFSSQGPVGLLSQFPWQPERLRTGNFVDAMALWRTPTLRALGGFTTDRRLHGWEDYDLWCRLAEAGGRASFVPEVLARYRVSPHSMLSLTNISTRSAVSVLIERYPKLMAGVLPPL
jgi:hypothetical protein